MSTAFRETLYFITSVRTCAVDVPEPCAPPNVMVAAPNRTNAAVTKNIVTSGPRTVKNRIYLLPIYSLTQVTYRPFGGWSVCFDT